MKILSKCLMILFVLVMSTQAIAGAPFYLTIERSFSNAEKIQLTVDYVSSQDPLMIQVLKPENIDTFLEGQLQISRSYEEPKIAVNPAKYMIKGLNSVSSPLRVLRSMFKNEYRKKERVFASGLKGNLSNNVLKEPKLAVVKDPQGFTKVRSYFIDLQKGGQDSLNQTPGFEDNAYMSSSYTKRLVELDPLPPGIYLIQAVQGSNEAQAILQVSNFTVQVKQSAEQLLLYTQDRQTNPLEGVSFSYRGSDGAWKTLPGSSDKAGRLIADIAAKTLDRQLVVKATYKDSVALTQTDFLPALVDDMSMYLMTDRPIFKPGEDIYFKGFLRQISQKGIEFVSAEKVKAFSEVSLQDQSGAIQGPVVSPSFSSFGTINGSLKIPEKSSSGLFNVIAKAGDNSYKGELRVRDYVKPTFYLEISDKTGSLRAGSDYSFKLKATRYSGGAPQDTKYEVFVYRKKFSVPEFVEEAGQGLNTGINYFGNSSGASALPERLYSSVEARQINDDTNTWDSAPEFDKDGLALVKVTLPAIENARPNEEWIYTLMVRAKDSLGASATTSEENYVTQSEIAVAAKLSKTVIKPGDKDIKLSIKTTYIDGRSAPGVKGFVEVHIQEPGSSPKSLSDIDYETDKDGYALLNIPSGSDSGSLIVKAFAKSFEGKNFTTRPVSELQTAVVALGKGEAVVDTDALQILTNDQVIDSNGKAQLLVLLPKDWGNKEKGQLWITQAGDRIYKTESIKVEGRSVWIEVSGSPSYGSGFFETIAAPMPGGKFAEAVMSIRQVMAERILKIGIHPESLVVQPYAKQKVRFEVTQADGKPAANVELSAGIVDRAVYAVQGEFRPGLIDFFFPQPKLNLMTFYSDDLQGYGYAEALGKPNFHLGALKSKSELVKKDLRDTAAWFPQLLTDAEGKAEIEFEMPANQTEWLITATAISKESKIGEATAKFRSKSDVGVFVSFSQQFRQGDAVDLGVRVSNTTHSDVEANLQLATTLGTITSAAIQNPIKVAANSEVFVKIPFQAGDKVGSGQLTVSYQIGEKKSQVSQEFKVQPASARQVYSSIISKEAETQLSTLLPEAGKVSAIRVLVSQGLLGAALTASERLLTYPYGCMEQLTHSTIPNMVLFDLLQKAGVTADSIGPLGETMKKADALGKQGIDRIVRNQHSDGGFGMWPSDTKSEIGMTTVVLNGLKIAADLGNESAKAAVIKGMEFLDKQMSISKPSQMDSAEGSLLLSELLQLMPNKMVSFDPYLSRIKMKSSSYLGDKNTILTFATFDSSTGTLNQERKSLPPVKALLEQLKAHIVGLKSLPTDPVADEMLGFSVTSGVEISRSLEILHKLGSLDPATLKVGKGLLMSLYRDSGWRSTFESAQIIFNLRGLLEDEIKNREKNPKTISVVAKNGKNLGALKSIPGGYQATVDVEGLGPAEASLLTLQGLPGDAYAQANVHVDVPNDKLRSVENGVRVTRQLYRIAAGNAVKLESGAKLNVGDVILSEVRAMRAPTAGMVSSRFLVIEDTVPGNGEMIDNDREYLADAKIKMIKKTYLASVKDTYRFPEKISRVFEVKDGGLCTSYMVWRVVRNGQAQLNAAESFDMYDESMRGNSDPEIIKVAPK